MPHGIPPHGLPAAAVITVDAVVQGAEQHRAIGLGHDALHPGQLDTRRVLAVEHSETAPVEAHRAFPGAQPDEAVTALRHRLHQVVRQPLLHPPASHRVTGCGRCRPCTDEQQQQATAQPPHQTGTETTGTTVRRATGQTSLPKAWPASAGRLSQFNIRP
ncbi:hypothetical protein D3C81_969010 [compost metagenome]